MPFTPQPKVPGDLIRSSDWNEAMTEIVSLDASKLNNSGGSITGSLSVGSTIAGGTQLPALRVLNNGSIAWGNSLSIDQTAPGSNDGPKIRFQKTMQGVPQPKSWSAGIVNGPTEGHFVINEDTGAGFGANRFTIAPGGNVGIGTNSPQSRLHVAGNISTEWALTMEHYVPGWAANEKRPFLVKGWSSTLGDYLTLCATGNRDNNTQGSIIMSTNSIKFGKGHNNGTQLTEEYMSLTVSGLSIKFGEVDAPRLRAPHLNLGPDFSLFSGSVGAVVYLPGQTPPDILNVNMGTDPNSPYVFRVGHTTSGSNFFALRMFHTKLSVDQNGQVKAAGAFSPNSADYAELFESENGKEIPIGTSVVIGKNGTVRPAKKAENPIGIVTKTPGVLGNNPQEWPKQYNRDEYGNVIMKMQELELPVSDEASEELLKIVNTGKKLTAADKRRLVKKETKLAPELNPNFDHKLVYIPRDQRPEWQIVGLLGQLHMTKGQPIASNWVKLRDVSDNVELWLIK